MRIHRSTEKFAKQFLISIFFLVLTAQTSGAGTINIVEALDAALWSSNPNLTQTHAVTAGDFLTMDVSFLNNESLKLTFTGGGNLFRPALRQDSTGDFFTIDNINLTFKNFVTDGSGTGSIFVSTQSSGSVHLGPAYNNSGLGLNAGQFIQFSGYTVSFDVTAFPPNTMSQFFNQRIGFDELVVSTSVIPVPAALPLLLSSLAGLGLIGLRRHKAT